MAAATNVEVEILVGKRYFLYLPLYLAQLDLPSRGKKPFFGKIPPNYTVTVKRQPRAEYQTDQAVFDELIDARLASSRIMFAACDPTVLLGRPDKHARMAASLIASSAFWAVNHSARDVRVASDLACFDKIFCYGEGTTSNLIARRIVQKDIEKLVVVNDKEIERLVHEGEGALAISPELLEIANLLHGPLKAGEKRIEIVYDLSTSKEFSNVLTTALFTRTEVLDQHPDLVGGLLASLQLALLAIHANHPLASEAARIHFPDHYCLNEALAMARSANVFPETIQVRHDRWQRACEFFFISQSLAKGASQEELTNDEQVKSEQVYEQAVLDAQLQKLVAAAITQGFRESLLGTDTPTTTLPSRLSSGVVLMASAMIAIGFAAGQAFSSIGTVAKIVVATSWMLTFFLGWWSGDLARYRKPSLGYTAHWISVVLSMWALHELVVPNELDAHFFVGVALDMPRATAILTIAVAAAFTFGLNQRGQTSNPLQHSA